MAKRIGFADLVTGFIVRKMGVMPIAIMDAETFAKRVVCIRSADLFVCRTGCIFNHRGQVSKGVIFIIGFDTICIDACSQVSTDVVIRMNCMR